MIQDDFAAAMERIIAMSGKPDLIVSALSGGMDSVVLLHAALDWKKRRLPGARLVAAHLNHRLRGEDADGDQKFCRDVCTALGVELMVRAVDVFSVARERRLGIEECGRLARYRFFHDLCVELSGRNALVLTGHHADDQAETILMHLRRGAHRRGLSGMREYAELPVPPDLVLRVGRPLLTLVRQRLAAYAFSHRLKWREDETNQDPSYTRNRIRHRIIPALENLLPGFTERLIVRAESIARKEEEMAGKGRRLAEGLSRRENGGRFFRLSTEAFDDPERLIYALRFIVEEEMGNLLPYGAVLSSLSELAKLGRTGEALSLPGRLLARREQDGLFFYFPEAEAEETEVILPDPPFDIVVNGLSVSASWLPTSGIPPEADMLNPEVEWFNPAAIRWPLRLRPPKPGERFRPLGAPGARKIQDILVDVKSPRRKRGMSRVLADHAGAIWLWPYRLANRVRLTGVITKALRVSIGEAPNNL